jgi:hypothetical protein
MEAMRAAFKRVLRRAAIQAPMTPGSLIVMKIVAL